MPAMVLISAASDAIKYQHCSRVLQPAVKTLQCLLPPPGSALPEVETPQLWCQHIWWWWAL